MLLIAELKELTPARHAYKALVKHLPDHPFAIDEPLYHRLAKRFEAELALWTAVEHLHMIVIATFALNAAGLPAILELSLMTVTREWLPVGDAGEVREVEELVREGRSFVKRQGG